MATEPEAKSLKPGDVVVTVRHDIGCSSWVGRPCDCAVVVVSKSSGKGERRG